jgi:hypothetical protein
MRHSIYFNNQHQFFAHKISDIVKYWSLTSELVALHLPFTKGVLPKASFGLGHGLAVLVNEVLQFGIIVPKV